jgi:hypothetical protein
MPALVDDEGMLVENASTDGDAAVYIASAPPLA